MDNVRDGNGEKLSKGFWVSRSVDEGWERKNTLVSKEASLVGLGVGEGVTEGGLLVARLDSFLSNEMGIFCLNGPTTRDRRGWP
jgi:hypothetical protein